MAFELKPTFKPTAAQRDTVKKAAAVGISQAMLCKLVLNPDTQRPIDVDTLTKYFREELDTGMAQANLNVGVVILDKALKGNLNAAMFWAKHRMGWRDIIEQKTEVTGNVELTDGRARIAEKIEAIRKRGSNGSVGSGTDAVPNHETDRTDPKSIN